MMLGTILNFTLEHSKVTKMNKLNYMLLLLVLNSTSLFCHSASAYRIIAYVRLFRNSLDKASIPTGKIPFMEVPITRSRQRIKETFTVEPHTYELDLDVVIHSTKEFLDGKPLNPTPPITIDYSIDHYFCLSGNNHPRHHTKTQASFDYDQRYRAAKSIFTKDGTVHNVDMEMHVTKEDAK